MIANTIVEKSQSHGNVEHNQISFIVLSGGQRQPKLLKTEITIFVKHVYITWTDKVSGTLQIHWKCTISYHYWRTGTCAWTGTIS